jgi:polyisoprenoid-binding protein YceI
MKENAKTVWTIDPSHSLVEFKVRHIAVSNVTGRFNIFSGNIQTQQKDFYNAIVHFELDTNSLDTNNTVRDGHLKSDLFFNIEKFSKIVFDGVLQNIGDNFQLVGDLTMLETTKSIQLNAELTGIGLGRNGDSRAGFEISGKLNRKDYGLNFNLLTDVGSLVVGEEIKLHFDIQLIEE